MSKEISLSQFLAGPASLLDQVAAGRQLTICDERGRRFILSAADRDFITIDLDFSEPPPKNDGFIEIDLDR